MLKAKTVPQLVAIYRRTRDLDKRHAIYRELLSRPQVLNVVDTLKPGQHV